MAPKAAAKAAKKQTFTIDCSKPVEDKIMECFGPRVRGPVRLHDGGRAVPGGCSFVSNERRHAPSVAAARGPSGAARLLGLAIDCGPIRAMRATCVDELDRELRGQNPRLFSSCRAEIQSFEKFLQDRIKVNGKTGALGDVVQISREKTKLHVASDIQMSKRLRGAPLSSMGTALRRGGGYAVLSRAVRSSHSCCAAP
eukprot:scaffold1034_cov418-Prasinococcus_capsulatus_cf.AAC.2